MRLLEHEDLLHLARLAIRTGFQYHREAERVQLDEVFAYTPKNFSET